MKHLRLAAALIGPIGVGVALIAGWLTVLANPGSGDSALERLLAWPIVCTARGCITTHDWEQQLRLAQSFAATVKTQVPSSPDILTTVVRRQLVGHAVSGKGATRRDAARYREEILHLKNEEFLKATTGLNLEQYDQLVIVPFLQQAALQQQRKAETLDELYASLSREHWVFVLPFALRWDTGTGKVVTRD